MSELAEKNCTSCRGGVDPLSRDEARRSLASVPDWTLEDDARRLARSFRFKTFKGALAFVNRVGEIAEREGHHPDICFGWGYADIKLYTHKIGGLHENDFIMAAKIDRLMAG